MMIGLVTTIVGDLATIFGCLIGLKDEATAILFVALGTSLPDLFASKTAAVNEKYADASVGNVTGSNSVNVFLGLGLPWVIAASYHMAKVRRISLSWTKRSNFKLWVRIEYGKELKEKDWNIGPLESFKWSFTVRVNLQAQ